MSLRALASDAVDERRPASPPVPAFRDGVLQALVVDGQAPPDVAQVPRTPAPAPRPRSAAAPRGDALDALTRFFPTEVMTIYIPGVATFQSHFKAEDAAPWVWLLYAVMLVATPALIWLLFDKGMKAAQLASKDRLPLRQMLLGMASFAVWGASVPGVFPAAQWILGWVAIPVAIVVAAVNKRLG